jgi:hypothetical protein
VDVDVGTIVDVGVGVDVGVPAMHKLAILFVLLLQLLLLALHWQECIRVRGRAFSHVWVLHIVMGMDGDLCVFERSNHLKSGRTRDLTVL